MSDKSWYLTEDAHHLYRTLSCIIHPSLCLHRLIAMSKHRIYGIKILSKYRNHNIDGSETSFVGVEAASYDYYIKVIHEQDSFEKESKAVTAVCAKYNELDIGRHYALGFHRVNSIFSYSTPQIIRSNNHDEIIDASSKFHESRMHSKTCDEIFPMHWQNDSSISWVDAAFTSEDKCGGTILMTPGKVASLNKTSLVRWMNGVFNSLKATHSAGYFHCDVRESNVIIFDNEYKFDYDHAVSKTNPTVTLALGAKYDSRGRGLKRWDVGNIVQWNRSDDYEMIASAIERMSKVTTPHSPL